MDSELHSNAPTIRAYCVAHRARPIPVRRLAQGLGIAEDTVRRWNPTPATASTRPAGRR